MRWFRRTGERTLRPARAFTRERLQHNGPSMDILLKIGDRWVRRHASPDPAALAAVAALTPATVVTGASEGLGFALARRIAREGRTIVLLARSVDLLTEAANSLLADFPASNVIAASLDVGEKDAPAKLDALLASHGLYLDVLVNNAGIGLGGNFTDLDQEKLDELVETNVAAVTRLTRYYLAAHARQGARGHHEPRLACRLLARPVAGAVLCQQGLRAVAHRCHRRRVRR